MLDLTRVVVEFYVDTRAIKDSSWTQVWEQQELLAGMTKTMTSLESGRILLLVVVESSAILPTLTQQMVESDVPTQTTMTAHASKNFRHRKFKNVFLNLVIHTRHVLQKRDTNLYK